MGKPSDRKRRARLGRPGKRERARVKRPSRWKASGYVGGAVSYHVKVGRKKWRKVYGYVNRLVNAHLAGDSQTTKSVRVIKRPLYTITLGPDLPSHDMEQRI